MAKKKRTPVKFETIEEYLARGGKITIIESISESPEFKNGYINRDGEAKRKQANRLKAIEEYKAIEKGRSWRIKSEYIKRK